MKASSTPEFRTPAHPDVLRSHETASHVSMGDDLLPHFSTQLSEGKCRITPHNPSLNAETRPQFLPSGPTNGLLRRNAVHSSPHLSQHPCSGVYFPSRQWRPKKRSFSRTSSFSNTFSTPSTLSTPVSCVILKTNSDW